MDRIILYFHITKMHKKQLIGCRIRNSKQQLITNEYQHMYNIIKMGMDIIVFCYL